MVGILEWGLGDVSVVIIVLLLKIEGEMEGG